MLIPPEQAFAVPLAGGPAGTGRRAVFDLLFLAVDVLPATVPVAVAMLILDGWSRRRSRRPAPVEALAD